MFLVVQFRLDYQPLPMLRYVVYSVTYVYTIASLTFLELDLNLTSFHLWITFKCSSLQYH